MYLSRFVALAKNAISYQFKRRVLSTSASVTGKIYGMDNDPDMAYYDYESDLSDSTGDQVELEDFLAAAQK